MSTSSVQHNTVGNQRNLAEANVVYGDWLDTFAASNKITATDLEQFRSEVGNHRYAETVLRLARQEKLRPKVLTNAAYTAWLCNENPKKVMSCNAWAELMRLAYDPTHEMFD